MQTTFTIGKPDLRDTVEVVMSPSGTFTIDGTTISDEIILAAVAHGFKQWCNDAHSSEPDAEKSYNLARKKLDALKAGELRAASTRSDEVRAEANRLAEIAVKAALKAKPSVYADNGVDRKDAKAVGKFVRKLRDQLIEADASYMDRARAIVAENKAVGSADLSALGL